MEINSCASCGERRRKAIDGGAMTKTTATPFIFSSVAFGGVLYSTPALLSPFLAFFSSLVCSCSLRSPPISSFLFLIRAYSHIRLSPHSKWHGYSRCDHYIAEQDLRSLASQCLNFIKYFIAYSSCATFGTARDNSGPRRSRPRASSY